MSKIAGQTAAPAASTPRETSAALDDAALCKTLLHLLKLAENYAVSALSEADELMPKLRDETLYSQLQNIRDDLENFDFDSASVALKTLVKNYECPKQSL